MSVAPIIEWNAPEHFHVEKTSDWYWGVSIIAGTGAALAFIFGNVLFGIFIIVGTLALLLHAAKKPRIVHCEINDRGIAVDQILYPFLALESFWIDAHMRPAKILLKSQKFFMPYIAVEIDEVDPEEVRAILLNYIAETEHLEPLSQKLLEFAGF
ncbi:MAG: hypothetical protein RIT04_173 [Candidatus Parcubacteria bacterium]|jgi:hypothetical protein